MPNLFVRGRQKNTLISNGDYEKNIHSIALECIFMSYIWSYGHGFSLGIKWPMHAECTRQKHKF